MVSRVTNPPGRLVLVNRDPVPKWLPGDMIGNLAIVRVTGHKHNGQTKRQWWYECKCSCGALEELNQSQLYKRRECKECLNDKRGYSISTAKRKDDNKLPKELDFARLKY